jgi:hypothetical protein
MSPVVSFFRLVLGQFPSCVQQERAVLEEMPSLSSAILLDFIAQVALATNLNAQRTSNAPLVQLVHKNAGLAVQDITVAGDTEKNRK